MAGLLFAVPTAGGKVCRHFGHADEFTLLRVEEGRMVERKVVSPPPHEPGILPAWLAELGVTHVIAAGMGHRAREAFIQAGIQTVIGVEGGTPEGLVEAYLTGDLEVGENPCGH